MKFRLLLPAWALLASCSALPDRPGEKEDGSYAQARNQACLLEAQRCLKFGNSAEAKAAFQHWRGPIEDPVALLTLARIHLSLGDRAGAIAALESAAVLAPESVPLRELLARFEAPLNPGAATADKEVAVQPASAPKGFVTLE